MPPAAFEEGQLGGTVVLDAFLDPAPYDTRAIYAALDDEPANVTVPTNCADTLECGGTEFLIHGLNDVPIGDASVFYERGGYRWIGRYVVQAITGPHQGVLSVSLRALPLAS